MVDRNFYITLPETNNQSPLKKQNELDDDSFPFGFLPISKGKLAIQGGFPTKVLNIHTNLATHVPSPVLLISMIGWWHAHNQT